MAYVVATLDELDSSYYLGKKNIRKKHTISLLTI